jgi:hypothetical protein
MGSRPPTIHEILARGHAARSTDPFSACRFIS